jgi:hypothetical protein
MFNFLKLFRTSERRIAWLVALATDSLQILVLPLFAFGAVSPADPVIDVITALILTRLLGWHWAFLPSLLAELIPGLDIFPTWTAAVAYVTWNAAREDANALEQEPERRVGPNAGRIY